MLEKVTLGATRFLGEELRFGSEGTFENSPAFQRRDRSANCISPEGTAERAFDDKVSFEIYESFFRTRSAVPSGLVDRRKIPGVETPGYFRKVPPGQPD